MRDEKNCRDFEEGDERSGRVTEKNENESESEGERTRARARARRKDESESEKTSETRTRMRTKRRGSGERGDRRTRRGETRKETKCSIKRSYRCQN